MPTETWVADSAGDLQEIGELRVADSAGDLQRLRELWVADSAGDLRQVFDAVPVVDSCSISPDDPLNPTEVTVSATPGFNCESIILELYENGSKVQNVTKDSDPNGSEVSHTWNIRTSNDYHGEARPFFEDAAGGEEGTTCTTGTFSA